MSIPAEPGVYLFEHHNFEGRRLRVTTSLPFLGGFDGIVTSWAVNGPYSATLFSGWVYTGRRSYLGSGGRCANVGIPWQPFGIAPQGCPGEVRNDEASSVGVGTATYNEFASPFYWPRGIWQNADPVATLTWAFRPDGTYTFRTIAPYSFAAYQIDGNWADHPSPPLYPVPARISTWNNTIVWNSGATGAHPNTTHAYRWGPGQKFVDIATDGRTNRFHYVPV